MSDHLECKMMSVNPSSQGEPHSKRSDSDPKVHLHCALAICPPWDVETPPLGISQIGEFLRLHGFSTKLIDFNVAVFHRLPPEAREVLWNFSSFQLWEERKYLSYDPNFESHFSDAAQALASLPTSMFGFSLYHSNLHFTIEVIRRLKSLRPEAEVVIGGPSCIDRYDREQLPFDAADYMVVGDGEWPLLALLRRKEAVLPLDGIAGLAILKDRTQPQMVPVEYERNLDVFPFPKYRDFDLSAYLKPALRIMGSRGCIARCAFCNERHWSAMFRSRSAEHIYAEMTHHVNALGVRQFKFSDLLLNGNLKEVSRLCDLILSDGLDCEWFGQGLTRKDMSLELLKKMSRARCSEIDFGVESGSPGILRRMRKPFTSEIAERVLRASKAAGIKTGINILVGFPGEGEEELCETLAFLERNARVIDKVANLSVCFVKPDSDLYLRPHAYQVALPPSADFWYRWTDQGQPTNRESTQRFTKLQRVVETCERHHIPIEGIHAFQ